ncbi:unnamed protein product [Microthlaspi erraticum]|uniref:FBD domain-containing protein n=1 Tax=Microthlaspi erraticum TaxID=1685480 RepID=A0A6D2LM89_9BRAS|nr:unnamed protein product [Microthlaspi erraticum]
MVPKLIYDDSYNDIEYGRFSRFVNRSLLMHEPPVIEALHFKLVNICGTGDIQVWIRAVDKRRVRELNIEIGTFSSNTTPITLPRSLYTCCRMLVTLKLRNVVLVDDITTPISFPVLKNLSLRLIRYPSDLFLSSLLSSCSVLEDLFLEQCGDDNISVLSVRVPSLKSLVLRRLENKFNNDVHSYVIDAPSLERVEISDFSRGPCSVESNMTKIVDAELSNSKWDPWKTFMCSIISAKRLYLCLPTSKDVYPAGSVFYNLVHLKMCTCETEWVNLLIRVLRDSPKLRTLKLAECAFLVSQCHEFRRREPCPYWDETSLVSEYLLSSLETFEWVDYKGTKAEKEVVAFILRVSSCLKKATIISSNPLLTTTRSLRCSRIFPYHLGAHQPVFLHSSGVMFKNQSNIVFLDLRSYIRY